MSLIAGGLISDGFRLSSPMAGIQIQLGRNVARLRKEAGLSQEAFADHAGLARSYVSDIERGARNPTIEIVGRLAKALKVKPGQLLD